MEGRRMRRQARTRGAHTLLPLRSTRISNTLSCWYCDLKVTCLNEPLYHFGQKHARLLRVWFTVGVGFSLSLLFGVAMILIWELLTTLWLSRGSNRLSDFFESLLFGVHPSVAGYKMSFSDIGYLVVSTFISVVVHEFGHAVAAASEGIQLEYFAVFLAVLFPGALVAFNYEILLAKPHSAALRIYCAGIWHNAVCCAACGLALLMLPLILSPLYIHGESPTVLDVSTSSPLSRYLSSGDVIVSLDGTRIFTPQDWMEMAISIEKRSLARSELDIVKGYPIINERTYCASTFLVDNSESFFSVTNQSACPDGHIPFVSVPCFDSIADSAGGRENVIHKNNRNGYCLSSADSVRLKSCDSLVKINNTGRSCICSKSELCLSPVQLPGIVWAEITYRSPYYHLCNLTAVEFPDSRKSCHKTFLYVGEAISMAQSVVLTSYQPQFTFPFAAYLPNMFEKFFVWTFQVSVALALFNSLPVYCLDGESILGVSSLYVSYLSPERRRLFLRACLFGGSIISFLVFLRSLVMKFW